MRLRRTITTTLVVLVVLTFMAAPAASARAGRQVDGERYTSPTYGFSLSWDASWYVYDSFDNLEAGTEGIVLAHGQSLAFVYGEVNFRGNALVCARAFGPALARSGEGDAELMEDENGEILASGDEAHAFATFAASTQPGGEKVLVIFVECFSLPTSGAVLTLLHTTPTGAYESEMPARDALRANLVVPSPGEPAPVFVSGAWRIAVIAARRDERFSAFDLDETDGQDWVIVVADVTNWGPEESTLEADALTLTADATDGILPDTDGSAAVAAELDLVAPEDAVPFASGQTQRLALAFPIERGAEALRLARGGATLPIDDVIEGGALDASDLPSIAGPPLLQEATVEQVLDGNAVEVSLVADGATRTVDLIGLAAVPDGDCFATDAIVGLERLLGETVWLEAEAGDTDDGETIARYAWTEKRDGTRILVNRKALERGLVAFADPGDDARFGAWLAETAGAAEAEGVGRWAGCPDKASDANSSAARPGSDGEADAGPPDAADRAYLAAVEQPRILIETAGERYVGLMAAPAPGDATWLNQLAFVLVGWSLGHQGFEEAQPTPRYEALHATCLEATALLDTAAHEQIPNLDDWFAGTASNVDISGLDLGLLQTRYAEAEPLLGACFEGLDAATGA